MIMRNLPAAMLGIFLMAALAGCGKKGPLEPPAGATPAPAPETSAISEEDLPIDLRPLPDGMGATRTTRGSDD